MWDSNRPRFQDKTGLADWKLQSFQVSISFQHVTGKKNSPWKSSKRSGRGLSAQAASPFAFPPQEMSAEPWGAPFLSVFSFTTWNHHLHQSLSPHSLSLLKSIFHHWSACDISLSSWASWPFSSWRAWADLAWSNHVEYRALCKQAFYCSKTKHASSPYRPIPVLLVSWFKVGQPKSWFAGFRKRVQQCIMTDAYNSIALQALSLPFWLLPCLPLPALIADLSNACSRCTQSWDIWLAFRGNRASCFETLDPVKLQYKEMRLAPLLAGAAQSYLSSSQPLLPALPTALYKAPLNWANAYTVSYEVGPRHSLLQAASWPWEPICYFTDASSCNKLLQPSLTSKIQMHDLLQHGMRNLVCINQMKYTATCPRVCGSSWLSKPQTFFFPKEASLSGFSWGIGQHTFWYAISCRYLKCQSVFSFLYMHMSFCVYI